MEKINAIENDGFNLLDCAYSKTIHRVDLCSQHLMALRPDKLNA